MSSTPSIKFRPSLSAAQISHLLWCLNSVDVHTEINKSCIKSLQVFKLKADHGIVTPSHVSTGRPDIMDSLGFIHKANGLMSQPELPPSYKEEMLYKVWKVTPHVLSASQLERVQMYRYTNDLMSPTEESEYESRT